MSVRTLNEVLNDLAEQQLVFEQMVDAISKLDEISPSQSNKNSIIEMQTMADGCTDAIKVLNASMPKAPDPVGDFSRMTESLDTQSKSFEPTI